MTKHEAVSARSMRARKLIVGVMAGGVLALAAPAGLAFAETQGDSVGRPSLGNPAPGVRAVQAIGDRTFNDETPASRAINGSPLGTAYHEAFGQRETFKDGKLLLRGENGYVKGALNGPLGVVVGGVVPVKECNVKVPKGGSLLPVGMQGC